MIDKDLRRRGVGGSEVAAVLGFDENRDAFSVCMEKRGEFIRPPATARMRRGKILERPVAEMYSIQTGREVEWIDETFQDPEREYMIYTLDARCRHEPRGVEIKVVAWDQKHNWGATPDDIPARAFFQVHYYMAATGWPLWDIAVFSGADDLDIYTVERDPELERAMLEAVEEFWRRYIVGDERPPIGASEASTDYLRQRFPRNRALLRKADETETALLDLYAQLRDEEDAAEKERKRVENELKLAVKDSDGLESARARFTWKTTKDSTETDWERLALSLVRDYKLEEKALVAEFTHAKPGVRRIHFIYNGGK